MVSLVILLSIIKTRKHHGGALINTYNTFSTGSMRKLE